MAESNEESTVAQTAVIETDPNKLTNARVLTTLQQLFGEDAFTDVEEPYGLLTATTTRERIHEIIQTLHGEPILQFNFLTTMCGIHYPENEGQELGVIYHLHSLVHNVRLRLKIFFPIIDPAVPTLTDIYATANWMERETFDFFGIIFTGHPNLIRILNVEDMDYHPMRREYPLEDGTREDKTDLFFGR
ncbi:NADH-quinone oxidoreductase subunit C [Hymenobacter qilianensis]|uniref:NADH-quinone oxidoreductase subunit C n=2 Tax=Hymenobacter qilianensis TaxID=1385715 RepID=A0ACB5PU05_9BACT|nr:NADH-quinone oxidoreductase subunit C [Hymenobacter qilianensis]QNP52877.1 NADH-quinone oxidoreductase subunit C [Hymenobacter qilianensis]GGF71450.1 NADH-quinone oxidoreductase subunit C [Hymenobacter qilianensis]